MRTLTVLALTAVLAFAGSSALAQSLGDLAKQQAERRKTVKDEGKVLTNKDVRTPQVPPDTLPATVSADAASSTPADQPTTPGDPGQADAAADKPDAGAPDAGSKADGSQPRDEKYWRGRVKAVHDQLDRDQVLLDALQSRVNALTADFVNRDDPAQRGQIAGDRQKAVDELGKMTNRITADKKAIADLEDEARRSNVPPGWLR